MTSLLFRIFIPAAIVAMGWAGPAAAQLRLAGIFSDHMVLQRDRPIAVWGWADKQQPVTVEFDGQSISAQCNDDGSWQAMLNPLPSHSEGQQLVVRSGDESLTLSDVLVGDVWHASGQSNMAMTVGAVAQRLEQAQQHIAAADYPTIRFRRVQENAATTAQQDLPTGSGWIVCTPQTVPGFSAAAFYFARDLRQELNVPIGIIDSSRGGTPIEPYIPREAFDAHPTLKRERELGDQNDLQGIWQLPGGVQARDENWLPARLFHSRLSPLRRFPVRGTIWYQGESNCGVREDPRDYQHKMRALITGWRNAFSDESMPFYFVQLPGSGAGPGWPYLREQQRLSSDLPHSGMVVTIDLLDGDIHPPNKVDVGKRLARWALADAFGRDIAFSGPLFQRAEASGAQITVQFAHCESGLMVAAKKGLAEPEEIVEGKLRQFELADEQGNWHEAEAVIQGSSVVVSNPALNKAIAVRYGYAVDPQNCNLYNRDGLPASPFCSDPSLLQYDPEIPVAVSDPTVSDPTVQIDRLIRQGWQERQLSPAEKCSDPVFVRRVYLDLVGRVPTDSERANFLADTREDRRQRLVDLLLASEDYVQHFTDLFDALLMGRGKESQYAQRSEHGWRAYLENVFRENRPWDMVVKEILLARPSGSHDRGADWFLYERNNEYQAIAEAVAPAFFGVRIECAQCHDHMMATEIAQDHYWGLVAFFNRGKNEETPNGPRVTERALGGFSEFANLRGESSPNLLSFLGAETVEEPRPDKDENQENTDDLYVAAEREGEPRVPVFSRRQQFVEKVVDGHPLLARAMVNRLWAILMGRGIVHPFDEMDSVHEPSHPELLDRLAEDFESHDFDIRRIVRSVACSEAYQLDSIAPAGADDPASLAWYLERPLTAEQLARSAQVVVRGVFKNDAALVAEMRQQFQDVLPDENVVTVSDALFLSNHRQLQAFIDDSVQDDHLIGRLMNLESHRNRAEVLVETAFGRPASESETATIEKYLSNRGDDLQAALGQVVWSLLTSAEFRFNH